MPQAKTISRNDQAAAERRAEAIETERAAKFCGVAKVHVDQLTFDELQEREHDAINQDFLVECFRRRGCVPWDPLFHIPAVVERRDLESAMSQQRLAPMSLFGRDLAQTPAVRFASGVSVRCLLGRHRIDAARECLKKDQQWWFIEIYASGERASGGHGR